MHGYIHPLTIFAGLDRNKYLIFRNTLTGPMGQGFKRSGFNPMTPRPLESFKRYFPGSAMNSCLAIRYMGMPRLKSAK